MVKKESSVYLLTGQDTFSKDLELKRIKEKFLPKGLEKFNLDILYAQELTLEDLQEKLLCLPARTKKRIVIIRGAQRLKQEIREFLSKYVRDAYPAIILILDIEKYDPKDEFIKAIASYVQIRRFKQEPHLDAFGLNRQIELKKVSISLRILKQLLEKGERPERILGGLRHTWERDIRNPSELKKRLRLLLHCDIDIKTGRLKASFALERFIVNLCGFKNSFR